MTVSKKKFIDTHNVYMGRNM